MPSSLDIANLVLELRQQLGLTQEQLAARLGVTFPTINYRLGKVFIQQLLTRLPHLLQRSSN